MSRRSTFVTLLAVSFLAGCSLFDKISGGSSCGGAIAYTAGSTATATLGDKNCESPDGGSGHLYTMTLAQQTNMRVTVTSTAFTPLIAVYTSANKLVAQDLVNGVLNVFLPAGGYKIFVSRSTKNDGPYTLTTPTYALTGCSTTTGTLQVVDMGFTTKGADISGSLKASDCGASNAKMHWYRFRQSSADTVNTTVTVDKQAGMYLINASGDVVASKELPGAGTWTAKYITTADGFLTMRVESRANGAATNLPLGYNIKIN